LASGAGNDVSRLEPCFRGWAVCGYRGDQRTGRPIRIHAEALGDTRGDALDRDAEPAAGHMAIVADLLDHALRGIGGEREADPDRAAGWRVDRRVDPDDLAMQVEGWPAGIAAVDRGVDLDEIVIGAFIDVAPQRRDDP